MKDSIWTNDSKYTLIYDQDILIKTLNYNWKNNNWDSVTKCLYGNLISGIIDSDDNHNQHYITVYPNPAEDFLFFDVNDNSTSVTVALYDIYGKKIISQFFSYNKQMSVSHLNSGIYFYKLIYNDKIQSGKIMIK